MWIYISIQLLSYSFRNSLDPLKSNKGPPKSNNNFYCKWLLMAYTYIFSLWMLYICFVSELFCYCYYHQDSTNAFTFIKNNYLEGLLHSSYHIIFQKNPVKSMLLSYFTDWKKKIYFVFHHYKQDSWVYNLSCFSHHCFANNLYSTWTW